MSRVAGLALNGGMTLISVSTNGTQDGRKIEAIMTFKDLKIGGVFEFEGDKHLRAIASGGALGPWKKISSKQYEPHPYQIVGGLTHTVGSVNVGVKKVQDE